jgi:WD40 repeat protein
MVDTLRESEPRTAMRLALAAWRTADLPETRAALRTAAAQSGQDTFTQPEEGGRALNAPSWLSGDGRVLTKVAHDRVLQWEVRTHRQIRSVHVPGLSQGVVDVSDDGRFVAQKAPRGHTYLVGRNAHDPSGDRMVLELWDVDRQRVRHRYDHGEDDGPLPLPSPDGRHLAWCGTDDTRLRILDLTTVPAPAEDSARAPLLTCPVSALFDRRAPAGPRDGLDAHGRPAPARELPVVDKENTVAVDAGGRTALTSEGTLVDVATGARRPGGVTGEDLLGTGAFSADGRYLAAEDALGRLTLWDARTWRRLDVLRPTGSTVTRSALAFSADGSLFAASAGDGSVQVWETARTRLPAATVPVGDGPVLALGFGPHARELHITTPHLPDRTAQLEPSRAAAKVCARAGGGATEAEWHQYLQAVPYRDTCRP